MHMGNRKVRTFAVILNFEDSCHILVVERSPSSSSLRLRQGEQRTLLEFDPHTCACFEREQEVSLRRYIITIITGIF